jgi:hypothetical protein
MKNDSKTPILIFKNQIVVLQILSMLPDSVKLKILRESYYEH